MRVTSATQAPRGQGPRPRPAVVGIDVGGTRIKAVLVAADGTVLSDHVRATPPALREHFPETVREVVEALGGQGCPVGVVVPGLVDDARGIGVWSANLGWSDLPLRDLLVAALGVPVAVGHDVRAGLLGEHHHGAAQDCGDVLFVPLGTGLAVAALSGGAVVSGSPWTGELGHVVVVPDGRRCGCGQRGCLETVASARGIAREYAARRAFPSAAGGLGEEVAAEEVSAEEVSAEEVAALVRHGDPLATEVWQVAIRHLATALAPVIAVLGTRRVVIGGGLVGAGEVLLGPLRSALTELLPSAASIEVVPAVLGDRAASLGAAVLASTVSTVAALGHPSDSAPG